MAESDPLLTAVTGSVGDVGSFLTNRPMIGLQVAVARRGVTSVV